MKNIKIYVFIVIIIIFPIIINIAYKLKNPIFILQSEWNADTALLFYGTILSFLGIFLTIRYNEKNHKIDLINKVKPFLILREIYTEIFYNIFSPTQNSENETNNFYIEYIPKTIYFVLKENKIENKVKLDPIEEQIIKQGGILNQKDAKSLDVTTQTTYFHHPYQIKNIGIGPIAKLKVGCNIEHTTKEYIKYDFSLETSETLNCHILSISDKIHYNFSLDLHFTDIYNNEYDLIYKFERQTDNIIKIKKGNQILTKISQYDIDVNNK